MSANSHHSKGGRNGRASPTLDGVLRRWCGVLAVVGPLVLAVACSAGSGGSDTGRGIPSTPTALSVGSPGPAASPTGASQTEKPSPDSIWLRATAVVNRSSVPNFDGPCAVVGEQRTVQSGGFIAGDFAAYRKMWPDYVKLAWTPLDQSAVPGTLTVTAERVPNPEEKALMFTFGNGRDYAEANSQRFFPSAVPLPERGTWRLIAQAGTNTGCFELSF